MRRYGDKLSVYTIYSLSLIVLCYLILLVILNSFHPDFLYNENYGVAFSPENQNLSISHFSSPILFFHEALSVKIATAIDDFFTIFRDAKSIVADGIYYKIIGLSLPYLLALFLVALALDTLAPTKMFLVSFVSVIAISFTIFMLVIGNEALQKDYEGDIFSRVPFEMIISYSITNFLFAFMLTYFSQMAVSIVSKVFRKKSIKKKRKKLAK